MSYGFEDRPHRGAQAFGRNRNKRVSDRGRAAGPYRWRPVRQGRRTPRGPSRGPGMNLLPSRRPRARQSEPPGRPLIRRAAILAAHSPRPPDRKPPGQGRLAHAPNDRAEDRSEHTRGGIGHEASAFGIEPRDSLRRRLTADPSDNELRGRRHHAPGIERWKKSVSGKPSAATSASIEWFAPAMKRASSKQMPAIKVDTTRGIVDRSRRTMSDTAPITTTSNAA